MKIPNAERAIVDIGKLRDYCLNSQHNIGKHKARLFAALLGMNSNDAEGLRNALLEAVKTHEARLGQRDRRGQRYTVDFTLDWHGRQAKVRSGWIIQSDAAPPRLVTAYPLTERNRL
ncbi:hypothetical protein C6503_02625 [Candidatus Poribacteria bacterium]|nr:MAG: hypothetical protein C6503_02625 [Candidatus Poribacteria bacterium]